MHDICVTRLQWPDPFVVKARIEFEDKLLLEPIQWVLRSSQLLEWQQVEHTSLCWIKGGAGKGKTMMTISIINRTLSAAYAPAFATYFFCQNADSQLNTLAAVLKGLILRLSSQQEDLSDLLRRRWDPKKGQFREELNTWRSLWYIFLGMLEKCRHQVVYIFIDALDECQDNDIGDFLDMIIRNGMNEHSKLRWLIVSRPLDLAERHLLGKAGQQELDLDANESHVREGIQRYIKTKVGELSRKQCYNESLGRRITSLLEAKAESTFLWVGLACRELEKVPKERALDTALALPKGLTAFYQQAFDKLLAKNQERSHQLALTVLRVMMLAYRPLDAVEMRNLTGSRNQDPEEHVLNSLTEKCSAFVTIRKSRCEFIHQSSRDFLLDHSTKCKSCAFEKLDHLGLGLLCLRTLRTLESDMLKLRVPNAMSQSVDVTTVGSGISKMSHLGYATTSWTQHLCDGKRERPQHFMSAVSEPLLQFFRDKFLEWLEFLSLTSQLHCAVDGLRKAKEFLKSPNADVCIGESNGWDYC